MKQIGTILAVAAFPVVAVLAIGFGILMAAAHLLALPALYLLERRQERRPLRMPPEAYAQPPLHGPGPHLTQTQSSSASSSPATSVLVGPTATSST